MPIFKFPKLSAGQHELSVSVLFLYLLSLYSPDWPSIPKLLSSELWDYKKVSLSLDIGGH